LGFTDLPNLQKVEISISELEQSGVAKIQCPECGAVWAAKMKGGNVFFANHTAPTRKRSQAFPRWMKVNIRWTLVQR
jgi:Zn-finger nucleic acid-binding protein